jgi:Asp-tRNA(Asn)/Glu-tRNA(Gln) amidotransferase A subunit family amidase
MDKIGPICRGVEDCAAALSAIYGPDGKDITVGDAPFNWNPDTNISTLRIGYLKTEFDGPTGGTVRRLRSVSRRSSAARFTRRRSRCWRKRCETDADRVAEVFRRAVALHFVGGSGAAFDDITRDGRVNQLSGQRRAIGPTPSGLALYSGG